VFAVNTVLFVPGSRPDRFEKARASGAGLTVIDLEDAVSPSDKESARKGALDFLGSQKATGWGLRINAVDTAYGVADLAALIATDLNLDFLLLPMVEHSVEVEIAVKALGEKCPCIIPLIETPKGLRRAHEIAGCDGVAAMMFGGGDFSGELGVDLAWEPLLTARQQFILACAEHQMPAIDVPFIHLDDTDGLAEECGRAERIGFAAKAAIHPRQVAAIEDAFEPSEASVNAAAEALKAYADAGEKAIRYKGQMLEAPLVKKYRAVIARKEGIANA
jgi:citrate lyase subunit beta/citryl-CoA lyase/(S)-citramalyl-CoA lyase